MSIPNLNLNSNSNLNLSKVLVVVDVQNCFISGGSYGGHETNSIDGNKLANSINQVHEIANLIDNNDSIILTRDYHPINHLSIGIKNRVTTNYIITHPSHCLNTISNACPRKVKLRLTNKENEAKLGNSGELRNNKNLELTNEKINNSINLGNNKNLKLTNKENEAKLLNSGELRNNKNLELTNEKINSSINLGNNKNLELTNSKKSIIINLGLTNKEINNIKSRDYITIRQYIEDIKNKIIVKKNTEDMTKVELKYKIKEMLSSYVDTTFYNQRIIGTNLSWLYSVTRYANTIFELIEKSTPIGINKNSTKNIKPNYSSTINISPEPKIVNGKKFIELIKGQLCNYESYSAFNYHLRLEILRKNGLAKAKNGLAKYTSTYITPEYEKNEELKKL